MYTSVVQTPEKEKSIRLPVSGERLLRWERMLNARKIEQQDALLSMIDWIVGQDDVLQAMILGQLTPRPDLIQLVLASLAAPAPPFPRRRTGQTGGAKSQAGGAEE